MCLTQSASFLIVLRLLRCGATVIVTTRFPHDSALRFAKVPHVPLSVVL
jgi:hypothetical protein